MIVNFSPSYWDAPLSLEKIGDALIINGATVDFAHIQEGQVIEVTGSDFIVGPVSRVDGVINVTVILPYAYDSPQEVLFPEPVTVHDDGPITLPGQA